MDITYVIFNSDEISDPLSQTNRRWERGQRRGFRIGFLVNWLHRFSYWSRRNRHWAGIGFGGLHEFRKYATRRNT